MLWEQDAAGSSPVTSTSLFKAIDYYENTDRLKSITKATGESVTYSYQNDNTVVATSSDDKTTTSVYNDAFLLISYIDEDGNETSYTYNDYYQIKKEELDGSIVNYTYNGRNLVSKTSDNEEYLYNNDRLIRQKIDNEYSFFEYNNEGDITFEARWEIPENFEGTIPNQYSDSLTGAEIIGYNYNNDGTLNYSIDEKENKKTCYNYSDNGKTIVIAVYKASDSTLLEKPTKNVYNIFGNLLTTSIIYENNNEKIIVANTYDEAGKVLLSNNDGAYTRTFYDSFGRVIRQIEPTDYDANKDHLPNSSTYDDVNIGHKYYYAENGNLSKEINRLGVETEYEYYDNSSTVKKETFDIYEFTYNHNGKISKSKVDGSTYAEYNYNNDGNPVSIIYNNGQSIRYEYDSDGNLWKQYHNDDTSPYIVYEYVHAPEETEIDTEEELELEENLEVTLNEDYVIKHKTNYDSNLYYTYYNSGKVEVAKANNTNTVIYSYNTVKDEENNTSTVSGIVGNKNYSVVTTENSITNTYDGNALSTESIVNNAVTTTDIKVNNITALTVTETENETSDIKSYDSGLIFTDNYNNSDKSQILSSTDGTNTVSYTYYDDGQLHTVTGNNYAASYSYDNRGNLTKKTVNGDSVAYTYTNDYLMSVDGTPLTYDNIGNVLTYGNKNYTWSSGRNLTNITEDENCYSYSYNKYGYRTSKTVNGLTTYFNVAEDGTIVSQTDGTNTLYFEYAEDGTPLGFVLNDIQYLYITNNSSDVMAISDNTGNILANYLYDEWGKVTVDASEDNLELANLNPLRYRGYYYDNETNYYYLQSRYYDPNICRFINADLPEYANKSELLSLNIFVYCCNNAINCVDFGGNTKINLKDRKISNVIVKFARKLSSSWNVNYTPISVTKTYKSALGISFYIGASASTSLYAMKQNIYNKNGTIKISNKASLSYGKYKFSYSTSTTINGYTVKAVATMGTKAISFGISIITKYWYNSYSSYYFSIDFGFRISHWTTAAATAVVAAVCVAVPHIAPAVGKIYANVIASFASYKTFIASLTTIVVYGTRIASSLA